MDADYSFHSQLIDRLDSLGFQVFSHAHRQSRRDSLLVELSERGVEVHAHLYVEDLLVLSSSDLEEVVLLVDVVDVRQAL